MLYILVGLVIRLLLVFSAYSFDINNHLSWSQDLVARGFSGFYETVSRQVFNGPYPNYPPVIIDIFYFFYQLKKPLVDLFWFFNIHLPFFPSKIMFFLEKREYSLVLMKLPVIIFDFLLFYIVYLFAKKIRPKSKSNFQSVAVFVLLSPIFIYLSSLWGQVESINIFFILLSFYLLLYSNFSLISLPIFTIALLIKPVCLIFLPVYLIYLFKKFNLKKLLITTVISILIFILFYLPFYKTGNFFLYPFLTYLNKSIGNQSLVYVTNSAFNFWSILPWMGNVKDQSLFLGFISYQLIGIFFTTGFYCYIIFKNIKNIVKESFFYQSLFLTGFSYLMFATKMHERFFVYLLPFLFFMFLKQKRYFIWLVIFSTLVFINLYFSWSVPSLDFISKIKTPVMISFLSLINLFCFIKLLYANHRRPAASL